MCLCMCFSVSVSICVFSLGEVDGCLDSEGHPLEGEGGSERDTVGYMCTLPLFLSVTFSGRRGESGMHCSMWRIGDMTGTDRERGAMSAA
jgi:hypothetical protein